MMIRDRNFKSNPTHYVLGGIYQMNAEAAVSLKEEKIVRADPTWWLLDAPALYAAAEALAETNVRLPDYSNVPRLEDYNDKRVKGASLMLLGMSIELILKGVFHFAAKYRPDQLTVYMSKAAPKKLLGSHDLIKLSEPFFEHDSRAWAILGALTQFIRWTGRYPCPKSENSESAIASLRMMATLQPEATHAEALELAKVIHVRAVERMRAMASA
jgi:hypothetical protein